MGGGVSAEEREEGLKLTGDIDPEVRRNIDEMWVKYDKDNSGHLEKKELTMFLDEITAQIPQ